MEIYFKGPVDNQSTTLYADYIEAKKEVSAVPVVLASNSPKTSSHTSIAKNADLLSILCNSQFDEKWSLEIIAKDTELNVINMFATYTKSIALILQEIRIKASTCAGNKCRLLLDYVASPDFLYTNYMLTQPASHNLVNQANNNKTSSIITSRIQFSRLSSRPGMHTGRSLSTPGWCVPIYHEDKALYWKWQLNEHYPAGRKYVALCDAQIEDSIDIYRPTTGKFSRGWYGINIHPHLQSGHIVAPTVSNSSDGCLVFGDDIEFGIFYGIRLLSELIPVIFKRNLIKKNQFEFDFDNHQDNKLFSGENIDYINRSSLPIMTLIEAVNYKEICRAVAGSYFKLPDVSINKITNLIIKVVNLCFFHALSNPLNLEIGSIMLAPYTFYVKTALHNHIIASSHYQDRICNDIKWMILRSKQDIITYKNRHLYPNFAIC